MMDLGSDTHCSAEGLVKQPHRIPETALPASMPVDVKGLVRRQTIPDALLYKPAANGQNAEYWIVELKFCRDTDKEGELVQAVEQHKGLCSAIRTRHCILGTLSTFSVCPRLSMVLGPVLVCISGLLVHMFWALSLLFTHVDCLMVCWYVSCVFVLVAIICVSILGVGFRPSFRILNAHVCGVAPQ